MSERARSRTRTAVYIIHYMYVFSITLYFDEIKISPKWTRPDAGSLYADTRSTAQLCTTTYLSLSPSRRRRGEGLGKA